MKAAPAPIANERARVGLLVDVQYGVSRAGLPTAADIRRWAAAALAGGPADAELSVRVVDEEEGAQLNQAYRHKQGPTNVLSFPFEAPPYIDSPLLGDLVICAPVVEREAREQGKAVAVHWAHMVVHGTLHLLGYDHQDEAQAREMEAREIEMLTRLGYPDPYADAG